MRLQVIERADAAFAFPYRSTLDSGGDNSGGFDLVAAPEKIAEITEAKGFPELTDALLTLNQKLEFIRTLGCGRWFDTQGDDFICVGYIETAFRNHTALATTDPIFRLIEGFDAFLFKMDPDFPFQNYANFEISPVVFSNTGAVGFKWSLLFRGAGTNESAAQDDAGNVVLSYTQFLKEAFDPSSLGKNYGF